MLPYIVFKKPPFRIEEEGWGEFDMTIVLSALDKGGDHSLQHDLNFQAERYEAKHPLVSPYGTRKRLEVIMLTAWTTRLLKTLSQLYSPL